MNKTFESNIDAKTLNPINTKHNQRHNNKVKKHTKNEN